MFLLSLSASSVNSSNSVEELTQFLWNEFNREEAEPTPKVAFEEVEDSFDIPVRRDLKVKKCVHFLTYLSQEQLEELDDWHTCALFEAMPHLKMVDQKGRKLLFHHWEEGCVATRSLRRAWKWADVIICCHSATLPTEYRHKAAVYKGGPVEGQAAVKPVYRRHYIED